MFQHLELMGLQKLMILKILWTKCLRGLKKQSQPQVMKEFFMRVLKNLKKRLEQGNTEEFPYLYHLRPEPAEAHLPDYQTIREEKDARRNAGSWQGGGGWNGGGGQGGNGGNGGKWGGAGGNTNGAKSSRGG